MSYAFDDYDAFLASFNNNNYKAPNNNMNQNQQISIAHDPSLTNSITSTEEEGMLDPYYDFGTTANGANNNQNNNNNNINGNFYLSPDSIIGTSNSSSPNEFQLNNEFNSLDGAAVNAGGDFNYDDGFMDQNQIKKESISSTASSSTSPVPVTQQHNTRVKLSNAVPHSTIGKRGPKKEKSSHNMIEKRYRTNINDKINALRDAVPALRVLVDSGDDEVDDDELDGLQPAKKLNKATILSKATEYIKHLEHKNEVLKKENDTLKHRLYGISNGNITPESSVSSYSSETVQNQNDGNRGGAHQNQTSYTNKFLLGGLACMVGAGLNDDLNHVDSTRSLFALPVFSFNQQGSQVVGKPLLILFKIGLILCVLLNFVFPAIFQSKKKVGVETSEVVDTEDIEDVRNLSKFSIWKTFKSTKDSSNNDYVKNSIIRCLKLKIEAMNQNFINQKLINFYVEHLWNYSKQVQLDSSESNFEDLNLILSLNNNETIHNEEYLKKLLNFEVKSNLEAELEDEEFTNNYSVIHILYEMINETKTNSILAKFMNSTINSSFQPTETKTLSEYINVELTTLFNPTDENISKLKENLSKLNINGVKDDEIFIMYASIIQNLIFIKKDFKSAQKWFKKLDLKLINKFNLLGFTSLYIIILSMTKYPELYQDDQDIILQIEEISGILRIWLGNTSGSSLKFDKRSQLIEFFVNVNLKINGLESLNGNLRTVVV